VYAVRDYTMKLKIIKQKDGKFKIKCLNPTCSNWLIFDRVPEELDCPVCGKKFSVFPNGRVP
jgi:ribosomal protein S27E